MLQQYLDLRSLQEALGKLPLTLNKTYARILASIPQHRERKAISILQFLIYAKRPLRLSEAVNIVAIYPAETPYFDPEWRMPDPREISQIYSSLVSVIYVKREDKFSGTWTGLELELAHFP